MKSEAADWIISVPNQSCGYLNSADFSFRDHVTGCMAGEGVNVHVHESVRCKPMHTSFGQPTLTLSLGRSYK